MLLFSVINLVFVTLMLETWTYADAGCSMETGHSSMDLDFSCSTGKYLKCQGDPSTWDTHGEVDHCALVVDCQGSSLVSPSLTIPAKLTNGSRGDSVTIQARHCQLETVLIEYRPVDNRKHEVVLDLSLNAMTSLEDIGFAADFREDSNVSIRLDGSNNSFVYLNVSDQAEIGWMKKVTDLKLDGNEIREIDEAIFQAFPNLVTLSLSGNRILHFPESNRSSIQTLDLSSNLLTNVDCSLGSFNNLIELRLNENNIATIEECLPLKKLFARGRTWLADNPLDCCGLRWLQDILLATNNLMDTNGTWCRHPNRFHFAGGNKHDFSCKDDDNNLKVTVGAVMGTFVGLLSVFIIGFLILKWRETKDKLEISALEGQPDSKTVEDKDNAPSDKKEPRYETPNFRPANNAGDTPLIKPERVKTLSVISQVSDNHYIKLDDVNTNPATGGDYAGLQPAVSPSPRSGAEDKADEDDIYLEPVPTPSPRPKGKDMFPYEPVDSLTPGDRADEDYLQPSPSPSPRPAHVFGFESEIIPLSDCDVLYAPKIEPVHKSEDAVTVPDVTGSRDDESEVTDTDVTKSRDSDHVVVHVTEPEAEADADASVTDRFESEIIPLSNCDVLYTPKIEPVHKSEAAVTVSDVNGSCDDESEVTDTDVTESRDSDHVVVHVTEPEAVADADAVTNSYL